MSGADEIDDRNAPSLLPPFGNYGRVLRFLGANEDFVWVLHFPSGEDVLWRWSVFDVSGSASEAELELSVGAELMDVADSLAVFRIWDDTDVESVVVTRHSLAFSPAEAR